MSTIDEARPLAATPFSRVTRVVKLHLANPWATVVFPWIVLAAIFVLSYAIWLIVYASVSVRDRADASEGMQYSGASTWIFVYMFVVAVQAITMTFPLALGFGSTRRNFYLGTSLTFVLLSVMWSAGLTMLSAIESATAGWGVGGRMFTAIYFGGEAAPLAERFVTFLCITLFCYFFGALGAAIWVRWRTIGLTAFWMIIGVAVVGAVALFSLTATWGSVGEFFASARALGVALWLLIPTAVAAVVGYLVLRRATTRS